MTEADLFQMIQGSKGSNRIIFYKNVYKDEEETKKIVFKQLDILLKNKYAVTMVDIDKAYILEFGSTNPALKECIPIWVSIEDIKMMQKNFEELLNKQSQQSEDDFDELLSEYESHKNSNDNNNNNNQNNQA